MRAWDPLLSRRTTDCSSDRSSEPELGIEVAERTVSRLLSKRRIRRPRPGGRSSHLRNLVSSDFFHLTVSAARLRVLFVLVVLVHHCRRVLQPRRMSLGEGQPEMRRTDRESGSRHRSGAEREPSAGRRHSR
jgi:hypothetical protein